MIMIIIIIMIQVNSERLHTEVELQERRWCHIFEHHYLDPRVFVLNLRNIEEDKLSAKHKRGSRQFKNSFT